MEVLKKGGLAAVGLVAAAITVLMSWPVALHPATMIYGREIVGRHAEPYSAIVEIAQGTAAGSQPLTDGWAWWLSHSISPVAAYNLVVLLSFPLSAMAAYALARYLTRSSAAAFITGLAFAFAPSHLAQAAYHPHVVQTQWMPLYVLALVAMVDRLSIPRSVAAIAACAALVLSNFYGALVAALLAPVILAAFWAIRSDADRNPWPFVGPALVLSACAATVWLAIARWQPSFATEGANAVAPIEDIAFYRARWWAYLTPPVDHPVLSGLAGHVFDTNNINLQLAELQLYLGISLIVLALGALALSVFSWKAHPERRFVPAALAVAIVAFLVSLGPTSGTCDANSLAPGCLLYHVAPMFRTYARFQIIAQLMLAVAAGYGAVLLAGRSQNWRRAVIALLVVAAFEYWPLPARAHDVLPTTAHRWIANSPDEGAVLDCYPGSGSESWLPMLMDRDIRFLSTQIQGCGDPQLGLKLAGMKISQVLVRRSPAASKMPTPLPTGITVAQQFADADLYAVSQTPPPVVTVLSPGFYGHEHAGDDWWRWMSPQGSWTVRNTTTAPREVSLSVNLQPIGAPRTLTVSMDGAAPTVLRLEMAPQDYTLGPWTLSPGDHELRFTADGEPVRPADTQGTTDRRLLTVSFRQERWEVR